MKKIFSVLLFLGIALLLTGCSREPSKYDTFAACLTERGAKMYGTDWCPHCKNQKEMFGPSFDKIDYINCDSYRTKCQQAGIEGYPTWFFKNEEKLVGTQQLKTLADKTNCELPK